PTVLWALALEGLPEAEQQELLALASDDDRPAAVRIACVRQLYQQAGAFEKAQRLIEKHQERAEKIADEIQPEELRRLLYYLIDSVLDSGKQSPPAVGAPVQIQLEVARTT